MKTCPECEANQLVPDEHGVLVCPDCGFQLSETVQICSHCAHINESSDEVCANCAEPLHVVDRVLSRQTIDGKPPWLQKARQQAANLKQSEAVSSQRRMDKFIEEDRLREERLREAQARQELQERRTLSATLIFTAVALVIIVIVTIVIVLRG